MDLCGGVFADSFGVSEELSGIGFGIERASEGGGGVEESGAFFDFAFQIGKLGGVFDGELVIPRAKGVAPGFDGEFVEGIFGGGESSRIEEGLLRVGDHGGFVPREIASWSPFE